MPYPVPRSNFVSINWVQLYLYIQDGKRRGSIFVAPLYCLVSALLRSSDPLPPLALTRTLMMPQHTYAYTYAFLP